jgi:hypothetical protein
MRTTRGLTCGPSRPGGAHQRDGRRWVDHIRGSALASNDQQKQGVKLLHIYSVSISFNVNRQAVVYECIDFLFFETEPAELSDATNRVTKNPTKLAMNAFPSLKELVDKLEPHISVGDRIIERALLCLDANYDMNSSLAERAAYLERGMGMINDIDERIKEYLTIKEERKEKIDDCVLTEVQNLAAKAKDIKAALQLIKTRCPWIFPVKVWKE